MLVLVGAFVALVPARASDEHARLGPEPLTASPLSSDLAAWVPPLDGAHQYRLSEGRQRLGLSPALIQPRPAVLTIAGAAVTVALALSLLPPLVTRRAHAVRAPPASRFRSVAH